MPEQSRQPDQIPRVGIQVTCRERVTKGVRTPSAARFCRWPRTGLLRVGYCAVIGSALSTDKDGGVRTGLASYLEVPRQCPSALSTKGDNPDSQALARADSDFASSRAHVQISADKRGDFSDTQTRAEHQLHQCVVPGPLRS